MMRPEQVRTYERASSVVFLKTDEPFGGLSNMAGGYPLRVNGIRIFTSEALYQACRFPHRPEVQRLIIEQRSPITAKMKSKPYRQDSRPDWDRVRVNVMRWSLRVKLAQNWRTFSALLLKSGDRPIVEQSRKDDFWGAKAQEDGTLVGMNVLGRLLMELRELVKSKEDDTLLRVAPMDIPDFLLAGQPIEFVGVQVPGFERSPLSVEKTVYGNPSERFAMQSSMFDESRVKEAPTPAYSTANEESVRVVDLKPYPDYKDSGLPWLGQVPEAWRIVRNGSLFGQRNQTGFSELPILEVSLKTGVRVRNFETSKRKQIMADLGKYKRAAKGDIAYNMMRMWQGAVGVSPADGLVSPAYVVARPYENADSRFFATLFKTDGFMSEIDNCSRGIVKDRNRLYWDQFKQMLVPCPPLDEQAAIMRFLDWANSRLERTVRANRKVIALLNEQKQAIIHRAVTRGLDPDVPLKDSGVPFIGEIPLTWQVRRLRTLVYRIEQGVSPQASGFLAAANTWGVLKSGCVNRGVFRQTEHKQLARNFEIDPAIVVKIGDVLISRACGSPSLVGSVGRVRALDYRLILSDKIFRACFRREVDEDFMVLSMNSSYYRRQVEQSISGAEGMANNLPLSSLRDFVFAIPSREEASEIALFVNREVQEIDVVASRLENEIELLREYRTRLIADVVTGKLDVRAVAATLPDAPAQGDDNDVVFDEDTLDDALDDAPDTDNMEDAA